MMRHDGQIDSNFVWSEIQAPHLSSHRYDDLLLGLVHEHEDDQIQAVVHLAQTTLEIMVDVDLHKHHIPIVQAHGQLVQNSVRHETQLQLLNSHEHEVAFLGPVLEFEDDLLRPVTHHATTSSSPIHEYVVLQQKYLLKLNDEEAHCVIHELQCEVLLHQHHDEQRRGHANLLTEEHL